METRKQLNELTEEEWESLCSHCNDCCHLFQTVVMCPGFSLEERRCSDYKNRKSLNPNCTKLTPDNIPMLYEHKVLTDRCNYVRSWKGEDLIWDVEPQEMESFEEQPDSFKMYYRATRRD